MTGFLPLRILFIIIVAPVLFSSCSTVPEAEFYEVEGIVSIEAVKLSNYSGWNHIESQSMASLVSVADTSGPSGSLSFPFYIQRPGTYSVWMLGNRHSNESDAETNANLISLTLLNDEGFAQSQSFLNIEAKALLNWMNRDHNENPVVIRVESPGHYSIEIGTRSLDGIIVNKLHLSLDNIHPPSGTGLPVTSNPNLDPLLMKREQRVELPPSWVFGPVIGGYSHHSEWSDFMDRAQSAGLPDDRLREWPKSPDYGQYDISDLRKNIEMMANPGLVTYEIPFVSYDMGGFNYNSTPQLEEELFVRWSQFATFNSVMYLFSREVMDELAEAGQISGAALEHIDLLMSVRKRLFPFLYSESHLTRGTGIKPVRGNRDNPTQFMLGDAFLVAPVYRAGMDERFVHLPSGAWYDYFDGTRYEGGQSWLIEAPLYRIPLFVKAGSIIPKRIGNGPVAGASHDRLIVEIYGGSSGTFRLYEDDGMSTRYRQGEFSTTAFRYFEQADYATFTIGRMVRPFDGMPPEKELTLIFKYVQKPVSVMANELELKEGMGTGQWYYDDEAEEFVVHWVQPNNIKTDFEINF